MLSCVNARTTPRRNGASAAFANKPKLDDAMRFHEILRGENRSAVRNEWVFILQENIWDDEIYRYQTAS